MIIPHTAAKTVTPIQSWIPGDNVRLPWLLRIERQTEINGTLVPAKRKAPAIYLG